MGPGLRGLVILWSPCLPPPKEKFQPNQKNLVKKLWSLFQLFVFYPGKANLNEPHHRAGCCALLFHFGWTGDKGREQSEESVFILLVPPLRGHPG